MDKKMMLVVDDQELNRQLMRVSLENEYEILEAGDGVEALAVLENHNVDVVVTDIFMDRMDGYELIRCIRAIPRLCGTVIIAVTENDAASKYEAMAAGADEFVTKPFIHEELCMRVQSGCKARSGCEELDLSSVGSMLSGGIAIFSIKNGCYSVTFCSDGAAVLFGKLQADFGRGMSPKEALCICDEDLPKYLSAFDGAVKNRDCIDIVYRAVVGVGGIVWVRLHGYVKMAKNGDMFLHAAFVNVSKDTELYRSILDKTNVIVYVSDIKTRELLYANSAACRFAGCGDGQYVGSTCHELFFKSRSECSLCPLKDRDLEALKNGTEYELRRGDSYFRVAARIMEWSGKLAIAEYLEDVTPEKRSAITAAQNENRVMEIINNIRVSVCVFEHEGGRVRLAAINDATAELVGGDTGGYVVGRYADELLSWVHPDDRSGVSEFIERLSTGVGTASLTYRHFSKKKNGYIWILMNGKTMEEEGFGPQVSYVTLTDITTLRENQDKLRESRECLAAAVRHSGLDYWEYDPRNDRAFISAQSVEKYGVEEVMEGFPESWIATGNIHPDHVGKYRDMTKKIKDGRRYLEWECLARAGAGKPYVWKKIRYTNIFDADGHPVSAMATAQSIGDLKETEENFVQTMMQNGIWAWELDLQSHELRRIGAGSEDNADMLEPVYRDVEEMLDDGLYHPDSVPVVRSLYGKIFAGGTKAAAQVLRWSRLKGDYIWRELVMTVVDDASGNRSKAICTSRDIADEKRMEQLYEDEKAFRSAINSVLLATCQVNISRRRVEAIYIGQKNVFTDKLAGLCAYSDRLALFLDDIDLSKEDDEALSPEQLSAAFARGETKVSRSFMARLKKSGSLVHIGVSCHLACRPGTGDLIAFFYNTDDTERYIVRQITDSIFMEDYDCAGLIRSDSGEMKVLGSSSASKTVLRTWDTDYDTAVASIIAKHTDGGVPDDIFDSMRLSTIVKKLEKQDYYVVELDIIEKNGEIRRKRYKFSYNNKNYKMLLFSRTDIQDMLQEERTKQRELERAFRAAEKANATKSEFLARMSHEIRTPLNGVLGLTKLALDEDDVKLIKAYLSDIDVSGGHLNSLLSDILDMSKIENGEIVLHPEICSRGDLTGRLCGMIKPLCDQKGVKFVYEEDDDLHLAIKIDRTRLNQVLFNLASNAVKFTPDGGTITLRYRSRRDGDQQILFFDIEDNGIGMTEEFQQKMFEPFTQESSKVISSTQGAGLGLCIAKALLELMGGTISVESRLESGTAFHVSLRVPIAAEAWLAEGLMDKKDSDFSGKKILVVEDHPLNRMIVVKLLEKRGAGVLTAENGAEAVKIFAASAVGELAVVLMDIRMPVMDGLSAAMAIRALDRNDAAGVPILAMTANAFDEDIQRSLAAGMNAHLSKPILPEVLYKMLGRYMH